MSTSAFGLLALLFGSQAAAQSTKTPVPGHVDFEAPTEAADDGAFTLGDSGLQVDSEFSHLAALYDDEQRHLATGVDGDSRETSLGLLAEDTIEWTPWLRTAVGVHGEIVWVGDEDTTESNRRVPQTVVGAAARLELWSRLYIDADFSLTRVDFVDGFTKADIALGYGTDLFELSVTFEDLFYAAASTSDPAPAPTTQIDLSLFF